MVSVDTIAAPHPYLPCPPLVETKADSLGWLLHVPRRQTGDTNAAMGQWWPPWLRSAPAAHFVSDLCGPIIMIQSAQCIAKTLTTSLPN